MSYFAFLPYLVQLRHSSARFTMSLCICDRHSYRETPSMASCPGFPRCIFLSTACRNCTGTSSLLSTRMPLPCTAICDHRGLLYGPISSNPCLSARSITRPLISTLLGGSCRKVLKDTNVSSLSCLCSFCSSHSLCVCLLDGSIVQMSCPVSRPSHL